MARQMAARAMPLRAALRFSARAPADGGAASGGGEVADDSTGRGAKGDRGPVGARAPSEDNADANGGATVVGSSAESAAAGV